MPAVIFAVSPAVPPVLMSVLTSKSIGVVAVKPYSESGGLGALETEVYFAGGRPATPLTEKPNLGYGDDSDGMTTPIPVHHDISRQRGCHGAGICNTGKQLGGGGAVAGTSMSFPTSPWYIHAHAFVRNVVSLMLFDPCNTHQTSRVIKCDYK